MPEKRARWTGSPRKPGIKVAQTEQSASGSRHTPIVHIFCGQNCEQASGVPLKPLIHNRKIIQRHFWAGIFSDGPHAHG